MLCRESNLSFMDTGVNLHEQQRWCRWQEGKAVILSIIRTERESQNEAESFSSKAWHCVVLFTFHSSG